MAPGAPCCPALQTWRTNPQASGPNLCADGLFCDLDTSEADSLHAVYPGLSLLYGEGAAPGVCRSNTQGCGTFGKPCCITDGPLPWWPELTCGADAAPEASGAEARGYCANAKGEPWLWGVTGRLQDHVCTPCPDAPTQAQLRSYTATHLLHRCGFNGLGQRLSATGTG